MSEVQGEGEKMARKENEVLRKQMEGKDAEIKRMQEWLKQAENAVPQMHAQIDQAMAEAQRITCQARVEAEEAARQAQESNHRALEINAAQWAQGGQQEALQEPALMGALFADALKREQEAKAESACLSAVAAALEQRKDMVVDGGPLVENLLAATVELMRKELELKKARVGHTEAKAVEALRVAHLRRVPGTQPNTPGGKHEWPRDLMGLRDAPAPLVSCVLALLVVPRLAWRAFWITPTRFPLHLGQRERGRVRGFLGGSIQEAQAHPP